MKFFIWFICLFAYAFFQVCLKNNGIFLGGIPTALTFGIVWFTAKSLCNAWKNRSNKDKPKKTKVDNNIDTINNVQNLKEDVKETLYFENMVEFIMYVDQHKDSEVIWE